MKKRTVQDIFKIVATEINKSEDSLLPFVKILKDNWFETEEDLVPLKIQDYQKLKIPYKIVLVIKALITKESPKKQSSNKQSQLKKKEKKNLDCNAKQEDKEVAEKKKKKKKKKKLSVNQWINWVKQQSRELIINLLNFYDPQVEPVLQICSCLAKIHENIASNPQELKYRVLKKSNKMIQNNILIHEEIPKFLKIVGFEQSKQTFEGQNADVTTAFVIQNYLSNFVCSTQERLAERNQNPEKGFLQENKNFYLEPGSENYSVRRNVDFYPDQTHEFVDLSGHFKQDLIQQQRQIEEKNYLQVLESLAVEKQKILREPPKDRKIKIYPQSKEKKMSEPERINFQEIFSKSDDLIISEVWSKYLKINQNEANFSQRKIQLEYYLKQNVYLRSLIRIKLPNNYNIQASFSPFETLDDVFKFVSDVVKGDIYLFTTPPRTVIEEKQFNMTLQEFYFVPTGTFHLGAKGKFSMNKEYKPYLEN